jgi:hypothetical protein
MVETRSWARQAAIHVLIVAGSALITLGQESTGSAVSTEGIVQNLLAARARQTRQLQAFDALRTYRLDYRGFGGERHAEMQVVTAYVAPNKREYRVISQTGSKFLLDRVLPKLLDSEKEYQQEETDSELSPRNYTFTFVGTERAGENELYILEITPKRKGKYLCQGKIWVDSRDFAIVRLEGEPSKSPSFWIGRSRMTYEYRKIGDFWLPVHKDSHTDVRLGGKAVLAIDYSDYRVTPARRTLEAAGRAFAMPQATSAGQNQP